MGAKGMVFSGRGEGHFEGGIRRREGSRRGRGWWAGTKTRGKQEVRQ